MDNNLKEKVRVLRERVRRIEESLSKEDKGFRKLATLHFLEINILEQDILLQELKKLI